eukprot:scaffold822_cov250-Pinguiococcus_pyrenoidosus.AAC.11
MWLVGATCSSLLPMLIAESASRPQGCRLVSRSPQENRAATMWTTAEIYGETPQVPRRGAQRSSDALACRCQALQIRKFLKLRWSYRASVTLRSPMPMEEARNQFGK